MTLKHGELERIRPRKTKVMGRTHVNPFGQYLPQVRITPTGRKQKNLRMPDLGSLETIHFKEFILQIRKLRPQGHIARKYKAMKKIQLS